MIGVVNSGTLEGVEAIPIEVEVDLVRRLPAVVIVGLTGGTVRESADRVRSALQHCGMTFPKRRVVINLAPADIRKRGTHFDLPVAVGILAASGQVESDRITDTLFAGELSLEGALRPIRGALSLALMAKQQGYLRLVLPEASAPEASAVEGLEVLAATHLTAVAGWLNGTRSLSAPTVVPIQSEEYPVDLNEVKGQARAKRALELAAAGGHNLLLVGVPGCGNPMLAGRMPSILPQVSFAESLAITQIHSVAGLTRPSEGIITRRPFRAPHHTATAAAMFGTRHLQPGEVSLAHNGVLFLDEFPEFSRNIREQLRGPLEDRKITLSRAQGCVTLPASFSLIAAMNPCPCGFSGHPTRACSCLPSAIDRYRARLSGPLLDRIDLQVWVQPIDANSLYNEKKGENSQTVRSRVEAARQIQRTRFRDMNIHANAELTGDQIETTTQATGQARRLLRDILQKHNASGRAWDRTLKVARTIADLEGADTVLPDHILEASSYRIPLLSESSDSLAVVS